MFLVAARSDASSQECFQCMLISAKQAISISNWPITSHVSSKV